MIETVVFVGIVAFTVWVISQMSEAEDRLFSDMSDSIDQLSDPQEKIDP